MVSGSCFCGNVKVEYEGEPAMTALCHCGDCKKISGGDYSANIVVPSQQFKVVSGTPKQITKVADSGKSITSNFCGDCGTTLFRYGDTFGGIDGMRIIKAGVLDDQSKVPPMTAELFAGARANHSKHLNAIDGAGQLDGMPPA